MGEHYYTKAGQPMHWIVGANGKERATTLRDARKLGLVPSFSTVDGIRNKYQLNRWVLRNGIEAAHRFNPDLFEGPEAYAAAVLDYLEETAGQRTGSDVGTIIHDSIESVCKGGEPTPGYEAHTEAALNEVSRLFPDITDWVSERTFANNPLGYGGMADLHSPSTGVVVDIKTKDFELMDGSPVRQGTSKSYRLDYDQFYQLSAYGRGLLLPRAPAANVFVSRCQPGSVTSRVWTEEELDNGWEVFSAELVLWRLVKEYDPRSLEGGVQCGEREAA